jgi:hypothetical protein
LSEPARKKRWAYDQWQVENGTDADIPAELEGVFGLHTNCRCSVCVSAFGAIHQKGAAQFRVFCGTSLSVTLFIKSYWRTFDADSWMQWYESRRQWRQEQDDEDALLMAQFDVAATDPQQALLRQLLLVPGQKESATAAAPPAAEAAPAAAGADCEM